MASSPNFWQRMIHRHAPSREEVLKSPWLKPFGSRIRHSELWRFTRRSVPRAVFAGVFVGIFLMVPGLQIVGAALLAIPMRANIPVAAGMTFLSNPLTTPFFLGAAMEVGSRIGFQTDLAAFYALRGKSVAQWMSWLLSDAAPALVSGLFLIGLVLALIGYFVSLVGWRWWIARKWRQRYAR
ncbi:DUF2062 domain-containing protein [Sphingomonas sp. RB56-2]|uniref:DUF2062 domain-containing protein n=1 Tax=Sphingomonas brevis TaxID=2908206 RepID=A0ABT0S6U4_9SPHN|nr:DUF2062 domain-containing protein [Sphingomonas brevis]MCL6740124.1 DUF2062 domain-containing protein [Sphingomonas brevis]